MKHFISNSKKLIALSILLLASFQLPAEDGVDAERFQHVQQLLAVQLNEAAWWRNACLLYFQTFSKMPIPDKYEQPDNSLEYYKSLSFPYAPGN